MRGSNTLIYLLLAVCVALLITVRLLFPSSTFYTAPEPARVVFKGRLKLHAGRCINAVDRSQLVVGHCQVGTLQGSFTLYSNKSLVHDASGLCLSNDGLGACHTEFTYTDSKLRVQLAGLTLCLGTGKEHPCMGSKIVLSTGCGKENDIMVVEEDVFQKSIEALTRNTLPVPFVKNHEGMPCDFQACSLNGRVENIKMLSNVVKCQHPADCVTIVVKTARRPHLVIRLADSIRTILGYDLRIVCVDDGPDDHPDSIVKQLKEYDIDYTVGWMDMGISVGRNLALKRVRTKYFMLVDDDHVFTNTTDVTKMVDILDTTDASLVGGRFEDHDMFAGTINFDWFNNEKIFTMYSYYCQGPMLTKLNPQWDQCTQCDVTSNVFIAKLAHITHFGGWTDELKIKEHTDFFIKMKSHGLKVAYCDDVRIENRQETSSREYQELRRDIQKSKLMSRLLNGRYNVNGVNLCNGYELVKGEPVCVHTSEFYSYC